MLDFGNVYIKLLYCMKEVVTFLLYNLSEVANFTASSFKNYHRNMKMMLNIALGFEEWARLLT